MNTFRCDFKLFYEKDNAITVTAMLRMMGFANIVSQLVSHTIQSWSTIEPNTCPDIRQDWGMRVASEKEQTIVRLIQRIPLDGISGDCCRPDVFLEDYLKEIRVMNIFNRKLLNNSSHSSSNSNRSKSNCSICRKEM